MKWKVINSSETKSCEEQVFGKCPATGEDVCITSIFKRRQICKTDDKGYKQEGTLFCDCQCKRKNLG